MLSEGILLVSSPRCDLIGASERIPLGGLSGDEQLLGPQQSHQLRFLGTCVAWPCLCWHCVSRGLPVRKAWRREGFLTI